MKKKLLNSKIKNWDFLLGGIFLLLGVYFLLSGVIQDKIGLALASLYPLSGFFVVFHFIKKNYKRKIKK